MHYRTIKVLKYDIMERLLCEIEKPNIIGTQLKLSMILYFTVYNYYLLSALCFLLIT